MRVAICDYGAGNVRSVAKAFERLGAAPFLAEDPGDVLAADLAVLPGVGSARPARHALESRGLDEALRARFERGDRILGICLGLQLALDRTEEDGGVEGLSLVPGKAVRITSGRVPRMGWARVEPGDDAFYFAHSYVAQSDAATATSEGFVAEVRAGAFVGVQFHPEKSGRAGARYLETQCLSPV